jgi:hypothetical protein
MPRTEATGDAGEAAGGKERITEAQTNNFRVKKQLDPTGHGHRAVRSRNFTFSLLVGSVNIRAGFFSRRFHN